MINTSMVVSIPLALTFMTFVMPYDKLALAVNTASLSSQQDVLQLLDAIRYSFYAFTVINGVGVVVSSLRGPKATLK